MVCMFKNFSGVLQYVIQTGMNVSLRALLFVELILGSFLSLLYWLDFQPPDTLLIHVCWG